MSSDDQVAALNRIADALELSALVEARKNTLPGHGQADRLNHLGQRIDTLTGFTQKGRGSSTEPSEKPGYQKFYDSIGATDLLNRVVRDE